MSTIPFSDSAIATSDASGNITFTKFQQPRMLEWRQGSFSVVRSDGGVVVPSSVLPITWKAFVGATIWGTWYNDQPSLMVQTNGPPVKVTGSNLAALTSYQCIYTGYDSDAPPPLSPLPAPAPPPSGFTTLVSGINNTNAIAGAGQYLNAAGQPQASIAWFPVTVGTALEIAYFEADAGNIRLTPLWSTQGIPGSGVGTIHNADTFDLSFVSPNNVMQGLTYINHGPFVAFFVQGAGASPRFVINTGLPPVVRPPSVPQGVLFYSNPPLGASNISLPPYVGPAAIMMLPNNTAGFGLQVACFDYTGATLAVMRQEQGWPAGTGPFVSEGIVYLPPLINQVQIVGAPAGSTVSGIVPGP